MTNLQNLQQRRDQAFAQESKVDLLESVVNIVEKWSCYDINFISEVELGISALQQVGRKAPPTNHLKNTSALFQGIRPSDKGKSLPILGGLNVDNFPRPDLSKWNQYKAEPGMARGPPRSEVARSAPVEDKRENDPRVEMLMVPEAIALLMEALPSKSHFTGPNINADEVLKILLQSPIAIPLTAPRMISIPISEPVRQTKRSGRWDDGDNRPMKRGK